MKEMIKNQRKGPKRLRHPPGPGRGNLLWLLAKVAWDVEEQLPRDPGQSFYFPTCAHWMGKSLRGREKRDLPPPAGPGEQGLEEGSDVG